METPTATKNEVEIYGTTYKVEVGSYIEPEMWSIGNRLEASEWEKAQFYLPTNNGGPIARVAVNIEVTGRTFQRRPYSSALWVKVRIEFVEEDFGPRVTTPGWFLAKP